MVAKFNLIVLLAIGINFLILLTNSFAEMKSTMGENIPIRSGPDENYDVKWEYGNGFPLKIVSKKGQWIKVQDFENDSGWVKSSALNSEPTMIVKVNKGKNKKINIRNGPGTNYKIIAQAYYGVVFKKKGRKNGWINVRHESGVEGWVENIFLWGF
jgi:SH3-like domain-containing protein